MLQWQDNYFCFCFNYFYQEAVINAMNDELPRIQEQVYYGHINSHTDVLDKFLSESGIQRYNPQVQHYFMNSNISSALIFCLFDNLFQYYIYLTV